MWFGSLSLSVLIQFSPYIVILSFQPFFIVNGMLFFVVLVVFIVSNSRRIRNSIMCYCPGDSSSIRIW